MGHLFGARVRVGERYGEVVGYTERRVQVLFDDTPPDEPMWFIFEGRVPTLSLEPDMWMPR